MDGIGNQLIDREEYSFLIGTIELFSVKVNFETNYVYQKNSSNVLPSFGSKNIESVSVGTELIATMLTLRR